MSFRIKRIGLALCLMMSLLIGHASACVCSHHVEKKAVESSDCHSLHESAQMVEDAGDGNVCDPGCVCVTEQSSPYAASKSPSKKFKSNDKPARSQQAISHIEFAVTANTELPPEFVNDLSYSDTLKSLLPARAPPRL